MWLVRPPSFDVPFRGRDFGSVPAGHDDAFRTITRSITSQEALTRALTREYRSLVRAIRVADVPFRVLNLRQREGSLARQLRRDGIPSLDLPQVELGPYGTYPRDLLLYLTHARTLLLHPRLFRRGLGIRNGFHTARSHWAEGGRVLFCDDRMIVSRHPERDRPAGAAMLAALRARGMRIAVVPAPIFQTLSAAGETVACYHGSHLDRSASLLRGKDGGYHLLLDPAYQSGPLMAAWSIQQSVDAVRRACARIDVEVHTPLKLRLPYGLAAVQHDSGVCLMSSGDADALSLAESIVGRDQLHTTDRALRHYPVFAAAGIHCLVTESPEALVE